MGLTGSGGQGDKDQDIAGYANKEESEAAEGAITGRGPGVGGEVAAACLNEREVELMGALLGRLQVLVSEALRRDVHLMVDAEHTYFQPAIEHVTLKLMREHNRGGVARVLNTYQAYLVDSRARLLRDLERCRREGWVLGAKLVRGAYLQLERRHAEGLGLPSPCWPSLEATHANFDACAATLIDAVAARQAEVLLGSHNQASVELAVARMAAVGLPPSASPGVMFGQLLGMSDHLTLALGGGGYRAYKYVPYGRVGQVMPYLLRRAAENQDIMNGSKQDLVMLGHELRRRAGKLLLLRG
ncbi:Proline dehydrogenase 1, mitochondrial [Tetrabaena socialis]|uniref:Proline dehydrogenase n=1 Tax=Tetrabaena socialis TaxID=47790 RepID=A0A2J7ZJY6_9CHLO|nr:Proline dehydrogenase 1, mitochondrial [Tetrabaena socialis]|eukprot:PNH00584.1 Proline dehydrogenase 1, mitochondrial [Tetrabaena socialis]